MLSANGDSLTTSFPISFPFISSFYIIAPARNSKTMLNKREGSGHPCIPLDFRGNVFSFSSFSVILA
jgi:hypothetical protein